MGEYGQSILYTYMKMSLWNSVLLKWQKHNSKNEREEGKAGPSSCPWIDVIFLLSH